MEHKWNFEIYVNGEFYDKVKLTAKEIEQVSKYINNLVDRCD